jgi:hypothetical protein
MVDLNPEPCEPWTLNPPVQDAEDSDAGGVSGALPPAAAATLRRGAFGLMVCLSPAELQHLHVALAPGMGGARRVALGALRAECDRAFKYTGKV